MAKHILIADDERPLALALSFKLKASGYVAEAVFDGEAALQRLAEKEYDLLLLDLIMPKKSGFDVLTELKGRGSTMPVLVSSNLSQQEEAHRALSLGASKVFIKSDTSLDQVVVFIHELLGTDV